MSAFSTLLALINAQIKTNGLKAITGAKLNGVLVQMVNELGSGYQFIDIATPATDPGTPDENVWYIASQAGTYTNFGGIIVNENEVCALVWNGSWTKKVTGAATAAQVSQLGQELRNIATYSETQDETEKIEIKDGDDTLVEITKDKVIINEDVEINGTLDTGESFEKKIVIEGDSITWGYNPHGARFTYYAQQLIAKLRGVSVYNTGLSDSTITKMPNKPQISSQTRMDSVIAQNPDIILLLAGVNDYGTNAPIGNIGDQTDETFSGAFELIIETYLRALPNVRLIYCTPTPYYYHFVGQSNFHSGRVPNAGGNNLRAYAERAIEICKLYSIPVVDTNHDAGWLDINEVDGAFNFTTDGIHLDEKGYNVLTNLQVSKIKELFNL